MRHAWSRRRAPSLLVALALFATGCGGSREMIPRVAPDAPPAFLIASADTALAVGDVEGSRRLLARALELAPENADVHVALGRLHTALRRYKDAKDSFDRAEALDPRSGEPAYWLGRAYQEAGDTPSAAAAYARALRRDSDHRAASEALTPILGARYEAAGIPPEYAALAARPTVSRAELSVVLAVELGADPDRTVWRSDAIPEGNEDELEAAWAGRWVRAAVSRGWIAPYPDGSYRLDDPVTRAVLALTMASVDRRWRGKNGAARPAPVRAFADLGPRHYLVRAASEATDAGLPVRGDDGLFEPWAAATGAETLAAVRGLARRLGATPIVSAVSP